MAPRKRPGPFEYSGESDDEASSASQSSSRKRRRTGSASSTTSKSSSAEHSDREASTPPSDAESARDPNSETENSDDDALQLATQRAETRRGNQTGECGVLEQVELTNFMCFKTYIFKLGPQINFICGKNGSGKSAILTAIVLCLGGKASATNRGSSMKDFIRQGQDYGSIVCRINNTGDDAFMPEAYGESIQIERHFARSGATGFKLKNARGRIVSTKRGDLEEICDHFGFQIENPMNVLTQDLARQFVTSSSAAEKYKFFLKGVLLEQLDQDYRIIGNELEVIRPKVEVAKKDLEGLKEQADFAKSKAEASDRYESRRNTWRKWRRQLAWEDVRKQEQIRDDYTAEIQDADKKIEDAQRNVSALDDIFQQSCAGKDAAEQAHQQAEAEVQAARDEKQEEDVKYSEAKREASDAQAEQRNIKGALNQAIKTIEGKQAEIEEELKRLAELDGGGGSGRLRELEEAKQAVVDAQEEQEAHEASRVNVRGKIDEAANKLNEVKEAVASQESEVKEQSQRLEDIRKAGGVQDTAYHLRMPQLLKAIEQERRFQNRPVGPIGKHVKLLRPEWASILEKAFGSTLSAFVVTSKSDHDLLWAIQKKVGTQVHVQITSNSIPDARSQEPDESFMTVLRALEIDHPLVRKILIIQHYIDNTALIHDHTEASRVMFPENAPRPRNLPRCYCFHPKDKTKGFMLHFRGNRPAQDPIDRWHGAYRMRTSLEDRIRAQIKVLDDAKTHLVDLQEKMRASRAAEEKAKQELARFKRTASDLKVAVQRAEDRVDALNEAINDDNVRSGNLEALRQVLKETEQQKELHEGSFMDATSNLDEKRKIMRALNQSLNNLDTRIQELAAVAATRKKELQEADKKRLHALSEKNGAIARVEDGRKDRETMDHKLEQINQQLRANTDEASKFSGRVAFPENETYESLMAKYDRLRKELLESQKKIGGTREELEAAKAKTATAYAQALQDVGGMEMLSKTLVDTMHYRKERWDKFQQFISVAAKGDFRRLLGERGFRGQLVLDHDNRRLDLKVEPDITKKSDKGRDARTLSGGEKTFTQICLLLAIWEAMGSPIRCLDEFDVFMDPVNRNMSVRLLIEGARQSTGKQFILISPGSKSDIPKARDVHRIEVAEPERGQMTLSFAAP